MGGKSNKRLSKRVFKESIMKNIKRYALAAALALTFTACGNNAPAENKEAETPETETTETVETPEETEQAGPKEGKGTAAGYGGDIEVTVKFDADGKIESVETNHSETEGIGAEAIAELEKSVVENNGTEGIDDISGATVSSQAFKQAVEEAIKNAQ